MSEIQSNDLSLDELHQARNFLHKGILNGLILLQEDLDRFPAFDPTKPYSEKNQYFIRTADYGLWTLNEGYGWIADIFFRTMLDGIIAYEQRNQKRFNKGMVYAILGIAQIVQGKFDAGIAHLLTAESEDREVDPPGHSILDEQLWGQFEQRIFDYLVLFDNNLSFKVDVRFLKSIFNGMNNSDRIFLQATILALLDNLKQNTVQSNIFTYGRLYSALRDMCLLIESLLRKKQINDRIITANDHTKLDDLLKNLPQIKTIGYPQLTPKLHYWANNLQDFLNHIENIQNDSRNNQICWVYFVRLIRNFTGHHFEINNTVISINGKSFSDLYETALDNVISALLYLKHINAI